MSACFLKLQRKERKQKPERRLFERRTLLEARAGRTASLNKKAENCGKCKKAEIIIWSSEYRSMADALELPGEEGRDKLRKAGVRSTYPFTPGCPNGVIR